MKLISKIVFLLITTSSSYAHIIYGIEHVTAFKHSIKTPIYVQMGSFSARANANNYQHHLSIQTGQKVSMKRDAGSYKVLVGPFNNYESLNQFAQSVSHNQRVTHSTNIKKPIIKEAAPLKPLKTQSVKQEFDFINNTPASKWFLAGQLGGQQTNSGSLTTVHNGSGFAPPYDRDIYSPSHSNMAPFLAIQAGRRWDLSYKWLSAFSLGAQYQYFLASNINGEVMQYSLPEFTNYTFKWRTSSNLTLINAKLNFIKYKRLSPYFNGGIGAVFNTNEHYSETALAGITPRISPAYQGNTRGHFAYILGAGIDYQVSPDLIASAGYQYSDLGTLNTGLGVGTWSGQSLHFGDYESNAFLFGLTYLFDANPSLSPTK